MTDKAIYRLPGPDDPLSGFLSVDNPCGECKHVHNVTHAEWYKLGDLSSDAWCDFLNSPVSSHVGTCSAFKRPFIGQLRRVWWQIKGACSEVYWWVTHRVIPRHRYHVINTGLPPGYWDPNTRLLAGIFEEVHNFVRDNHWDWDASKRDREAYAAFQAADKFGCQYIKKLTNGELTDDEECLAAEHAKKSA